VHNDLLRSRDWPEENRLYAHGQGYDLVVRPAIGDDELMELKTNMNLVIHLAAVSKTVFAWICDNYLVTDNGVSASLDKPPKKTLEL
jgi:hypothetical protein